MIVYRHCDPRFPFLWEGRAQGAGRWNAEGSTIPVQYFADTPDGAWAEFLRHEEITTEAELANIRRAMWAVELPESIDLAKPSLPDPVVTGGLGSYHACQIEAERIGLPELRDCASSQPHWFRARPTAGEFLMAYSQLPIGTALYSPCLVRNPN